MANITVSVPKDLSERMKRHSEVKWSEVVRKALADYVYRLETVEAGVLPMKELAKKQRSLGNNVSTVNIVKAIEYYEKGRKLEWKRLSTTQTS
jgi:hypothetical protein